MKALNEFLSLVQNGFKVIDAHANDASDADHQKQNEALRARSTAASRLGARTARGAAMRKGLNHTAPCAVNG